MLPSVHNLAASSFIYLRNLFKKKRTAATHVLVLMLSDGKRSKKPYALPVCYAPCRTLKDQFVRDLTKDLKEEMRKWELRVKGKPVTNLLPFPLLSLIGGPVTQKCTSLQIKRSGFKPWPGHCIVFLGKTLNCQSASLHLGVHVPKWLLGKQSRLTPTYMYLPTTFSDENMHFEPYLPHFNDLVL